MTCIMHPVHTFPFRLYPLRYLAAGSAAAALQATDEIKLLIGSLMVRAINMSNAITRVATKQRLVREPRPTPRPKPSLRSRTEPIPKYYLALGGAAHVAI